MNQVGSVGLIAAVAFALYALVAGALGGRLRSLRVTRSAERAALAFFAMVTLAVLALEYQILTDSFGSAYVAAHSNRALPIYYKIPVLWSGQEGSLLFWTWLLSIYSALVVLMNRRRNRQLMPYVVSILMGTGVFFSTLILFFANPFSELSAAGAGGALRAFVPPDGNGLTPALQYPSMVIHPPMLYLGYVGMVVPFAFAMAALISRQLGDNWIRTTRRWTMVPWMFLGVGIVLGGNWAYEVLGWGGYWAWDPVENASLLPWLAGTAFLHSVMIQEKRGMLKVWNMVLVIATFFLSIFGTFLTRSGIVSSVHAFAQSNIGPFFAAFLGVIVVFSLTLLFLRLDFLKSENQLDSVVSRESGFLFNNWVLLAAVFAVLWGTIFPIVSKAVQNQTVTVGAPFFNRFMVPIGLILLFLTGAGPLLAWRKTSFQSIKQNFTIPMAIAVVFTIAAYVYGVRGFYVSMTVLLTSFVAVATVAEFYKGARTRQRTLHENLLQALYHLTMRNTRRYGGYVIHLGIVILFVGFLGQAFKSETKTLMAEGDLMHVKDYTLRLQSFSTGDNPNYESERATLSVIRDGQALGSVEPEQRFYKASQEAVGHVSIRSSSREDLYVVLAGQDPDTKKAIVQVFINPLVMWVWVGGAVVFLGTLLALVPSRVEREMAEMRREQEAAVGMSDLGALE
ncbi:MAG TPA: heme lyase CcmF/NrfE family subunit [Terriglobia bacterium]|nr:heme lyase CcmF/NrfE family subunit [Terriglobia bacterium]